MRCSTRASNIRRAEVSRPERRMSILDFDAELVKAGATAHTRLARLRYLIWRNPLGAAGAAIMGLVVFAAAFANPLTRYDPLSINAALSLSPPSRAHCLPPH